jgi:probable HAF family extracellular repeat protein
MIKGRLLAFVTGLALALGIGEGLAEARSIKDLGTLGGANSIARAVNQSGQIVGESDTAGGLTHAFIFTPWVGRLQDLGTLGGRFSFAGGLNSRGQVVGASSTVADDVNGFSRAVIWDQGRIRALPPSPSAFQSDSALAINDNGVIVGASNDGPVIWQTNGTVRHLFATGNGFASGINNSNVIVGNVSDTGNFHGFMIRNGVAINLDNIVGPESSADAVTDSGNVAGSYFPVGSDRPHGFLYNYFTNRVTDLGVLQAFSLAHAVSQSGLVAGEGGDQGSQAVFWDNNHVIHALGFLPGGTFSAAFGINDGGTAIGFSGTAQFNQHAVAWLP